MNNKQIQDFVKKNRNTLVVVIILLLLVVVTLYQKSSFLSKLGLLERNAVESTSSFQ